MSGSDDLRVWVSDIDDYVNIDAISDEYILEQEHKRLEDELHLLGDIPLLSGRSISAETLNSRGTSPDAWRWALHRAASSLGDASGSILEEKLTRSLVELGRRYAISRYAKWEKLKYPAALTATMHFGIRALLDQFCASERALAEPEHRAEIQRALREAAGAASMTAYERTGMVRSMIHQRAQSPTRPTGHLSLNRYRMREILSLCRLYFLAIEISVCDFKSLHRLNLLYDHCRRNSQKEEELAGTLNGRYIVNWKMRHLHPLTFQYPYSVRGVIERGIRHIAVEGHALSHGLAVNELALAHSGIELMRQRTREYHLSQ